MGPHIGCTFNTFSRFLGLNKKHENSTGYQIGILIASHITRQRTFCDVDNLPFKNKLRIRKCLPYSPGANATARTWKNMAKG